MSTVALRPSQPTSNVLVYTAASSQDEVPRILHDWRRHFELPATRQERRRALSCAFDAFAQSRKSEDASPISEATYKEAIDFLNKLPSTLPIPEVVAEPDGDLALEWYLGKYHSFVVGFSGESVITYSGLFGKGRRTHGTEIISEGIPSSIVENIRRVFTEKYAR